MIDDRTSKIAEQFFYYPFNIYSINHKDDSLIRLDILDDPEEKGKK
jgi:hypothetical protein